MMWKPIFAQRLTWALLVVAVIVALAPGSRAADHRDGTIFPNTQIQGLRDINDIFVFRSPTTPNNTVVAMTFQPFVGVVGTPTMPPETLFEISFSNDGDPLTNEFIFQTQFSPPNTAGQQQFQLRRIDGDNPPVVVATGITNGRPANIKGGGRVTAGIFDDPFFFDAGAFALFNREATILALNRTTGFPLPPDITPQTDPARHFFDPSLPNNFFGGINTNAIVIEIPRLRLQSSRTNPNITLWGRTIGDTGDGRGFAQADRMGNPAINTAIVPLTRTVKGEVLPNGFNDQFNHIGPPGDIGCRPMVVDRLQTVFGLSLDQSNAIANQFLPDVMRFNTTSTAGFPNGRRLRDDVIDIELNLLSAGAITTDRVPSDSYFRRSFPFLGPANPILGELP